MKTRGDVLESLKSGQNPPLVWLYCSDSRVDHNIFGTDPGVIFSIENAGNIFGLGDESKSTMAYALTHFAVDGRLSIFVMGHTLCGAVTAACNHSMGHAHPLHPSLENLIRYLEPAVREARDKTTGAGVVDYAIRANVLRQMRAIKEFAFGVEGIKARDVAVYGGIYTISKEDDLLPIAWKLIAIKDGTRNKDGGIEEINLARHGGSRNLDSLVQEMGLKDYVQRRYERQEHGH